MTYQPPTAPQWYDEDAAFYEEEPPAFLPAPAAYLSLLAAVGVLVLLGSSLLFILQTAPAFAAAGHAAPQATALPTRPSSAAIAPFFTPEVRHWEQAIVAWSQAYHLDPNLVATVMQIESCGDPQAVSSAGARGLFQVMPFHFAPTDNPFDPETNARRGLAYLRQAWERSGGDPSLTLAGYNGGLGVIGLPANLWPAETRLYVHLGAPIYADARAGKTQSPALQAWYTTRGRSLCWQAHRRLGLP